MGSKKASTKPREPEPPRPLPDAGYYSALAIIALFALTIRAIHTLSLLRSPLGTTLVEDAAYYHAEALRIGGLVAGATPSGPTFMNLGYPYALAAIYAVLGPQVGAALAVQALAGALSAVCLAIATTRIGADRRTGLLAGAITAIYAPAIFYDGLLLTPALVNAALAGALALIAYQDKRAPHLRLAAAGLLLGAAALVRANVLLAIPLLAVAVAGWAIKVLHHARGKALRRAVVFTVAAMALPVLVSAGIGIRHGEWVPVSANGGMNFWVGNGPEATGVYTPASFLRDVNPAAEEHAYLDEARHRTGNAALTLAGASRYWLREGLAEAAQAPSRWLSLEGRKLVLFWNAFEVNTNVSLAFIRRFSPLLAWLQTGYGLLAILGAPGLTLLALRLPARAAYPLAILAAAAATALLFFVSGEYRHPASLALAIGAAYLVMAIIDAGQKTTHFERGELPALVITSVVIVPMALWSFPPLRAGCDPRYDFANAAREMASRHPGSPLPGRAEFDRALALLDRAPDANRDPVILDTRAAVETAAAAAVEDRRYPAAALRDLEALAKYDLTPGRGNYSDAFLRRAALDLRARARMLAAIPAVRDDPALSRSADLLGANGWRRVDVFLRAGDVNGASAYVDDALVHAPHDPDLMAEKGRVLLHAGREQDGLAWLERSCNTWPDTPRCAVYAAEWLGARGRAAEARQMAQEALRRDPGSREARAILDRIPG